MASKKKKDGDVTGLKRNSDVVGVDALAWAGLR
jgi:hypothetical protein